MDRDDDERTEVASILRGTEGTRCVRGLAGIVLSRAWTMKHAPPGETGHAEVALQQSADRLVELAELDDLAAILASWTDFVLVGSGAIPVEHLPSRWASRPGETKPDVELTFSYSDGTDAQEGFPFHVRAASEAIAAAVGGDLPKASAALGRVAPGELAYTVGHAAMAAVSLVNDQPSDWITPAALRLAERCPACDAPIAAQHQAACGYGWCRGTGRELTVCAETRHVSRCERSAWDGAQPGTVEAVQGGFHRAWHHGSGWVPVDSSYPGADVDVDRMRSLSQWCARKQLWEPKA